MDITGHLCRHQKAYTLGTAGALLAALAVPAWGFIYPSQNEQQALDAVRDWSSQNSIPLNTSVASAQNTSGYQRTTVEPTTTADDISLPRLPTLAALSENSPSAPRLGNAYIDGLSKITTAGSFDAAAKNINQIQKGLPFEISEDAVKRGLNKVAPIVNGAEKDLGVTLTEADRANVMTATLTMYKLTEGLVEALRLGTENPTGAFAKITDINGLLNLSTEDKIKLGRAVEARGSLQRAQLGTLLFNQFSDIINGLVSNPSNAQQLLNQLNALGWRTK